jgi:hypothetical protein
VKTISEEIPRIRTEGKKFIYMAKLLASSAGSKTNLKLRDLFILLNIDNLSLLCTLRNRDEQFANLFRADGWPAELILAIAERSDADRNAQVVKANFISLGLSGEAECQSVDGRVLERA